LLEDNLGKLCGFTPILIVANKHNFVLVDKFVQFEGTSTIGNSANGIIRRSHGIEVLPGIAGSIPTTIFTNPFLVHNRTPVVGKGGDERTPCLFEGHGNGASGIIRYNRGLNGFAGSFHHSRIGGNDSSAIVVEVAFGIDKQ